MNRRIRAFSRDEDGAWRAHLDCGHSRHLRHHPPQASRPWVETPEGRDARLDSLLDCPPCDRLEPPEGLVAYRQTPDFTAETVPAGLTRAHSTRSGVWGRIEVLAGHLVYVLEPPDTRRFELGPGLPGIIPPERRHHVEPTPGVRFRVVFLRPPEPGGPSHG